MIKNYAMVGALFLSASLCVYGQNDTVNIDFGSSSNSSASPWNNLTLSQNDTVIPLTNINGSVTGMRIAVTDSFNVGANSSGVTNDPKLPASATGDSFFGAIQPGSVGGNQITGGVTFYGLDPAITYNFGFYASRVDGSSNRETKYIAEGVNKDSTALDVAVSNPGPTMMWVNGIMPKADSTIVITATVGPNNTNSAGYYYLGAIQVVYDPIVLPPPPVPVATDTLYVDFGNANNPTPSPWNNFTESQNDTVKVLMDWMGAMTNMRMAVTDSFNVGSNTAGITNDPILPGSATGDSFFGAILAGSVGGNQNTGGVTLYGLDPAVKYHFGFYASRVDNSGNRETKYIAEGINKDSTALDPAVTNPNPVMTWVYNIEPRMDSTITITATVGPNNNNSAGYYYLGALAMAYTPQLPPPPVPSATDTINIDLGDAGNTSAAPWNNITDYTMGSIANLTTSTGYVSNISIAVTDSFNLINTAGVSNDPSLPASATGDSFFGSMQPGVGGNETTGGFTISGLDASTMYHFGFYASRVASDNRETMYIAEGANSDTTYLDAGVSNPGPQMVWVYNIMPDANGEIVITATAGPNNNNSAGYYYIGAISMAFNGNFSGIAETALSNKNVKIYPNPAKNLLNVAGTEGALIQNISIINLNGQVLQQIDNINQTSEVLNVEKLASGVYFVKTETSKGVNVSRVVIR